MAMLTAIVPVYNKRNYLEACFDSIRSQTLSDFEVILIDDGSTDGSAELCDLYAAKDSRFRVMHLTNGGVSHARNVGILEASAPLVTFIDSDDWVEPVLFEKYVQALSADEEIDAVKVGYFTERANGENITSTNNDASFEDKADLFKLLEESTYYSFVWNLCVRKCVIDGLTFNEQINWLEDHIFSYQVYLRCKKVAVLHHPLYHYVLHEDPSRLSFVRNPKVIAIASRLEHTLKKTLNNDKYSKLDKDIEDNLRYNISRYVSAIYLTKQPYSRRKMFSKEFKDVAGLFYREEKIFFSHYPFFLKDLLLRLFFVIKNWKNKKANVN